MLKIVQEKLEAVDQKEPSLVTVDKSLSGPASSIDANLFDSVDGATGSSFSKPQSASKSKGMILFYAISG